MRRGERRLPQYARRQHVERPEPRGLGLSDIKRLAIWRQADPVRGQDRMRDLGDLRAVGERVIHTTPVTIARTGLAQIGEVKAAETVEHDVVRSQQFMRAAMI